jgi:hypothetical protein
MSSVNRAEGLPSAHLSHSLGAPSQLTAVNWLQAAPYENERETKPAGTRQPQKEALELHRQIGGAPPVPKAGAFAS